MKIENKFGVTKQMWDQWCPKAQILYNDLYSLIHDIQQMFQHTCAEEVPAEHWQVTAHNVACEAAGRLNEIEEYGDAQLS